jgi:hydrogenase maturation protease HycI
MKDLYECLTERLNGAESLVILGVGSFLKSDDAAGVIITEKLKETFNSKRLCTAGIFTGESAPENYTGKIKKSNPDHLLILDAADMGKEPGAIGFIELDQIGETSFSTHMLPIKIMLDYIQKEINCGIIILGIQPESLLFAGEVTPKVSDSIDYVASVMERIITKLEENYKSCL